MLLGFHIAAAYYGSNLLAPKDLHKVLKYFGATAAYLPAVLVVAVLLLQHLFHSQPWKIHPQTLAGMFGESVIGMIPLVAMSLLTGRLIAQQAIQTGPAIEACRETLPQVLTGFGAGVYEEFIFRLVFISLILLIFVDILGLKKELPTIVAVLIGAVVFSLYHFSAEQITGTAPFPTQAFVFYAIAGIYLGGLYVFRGFGIAVGAHAFYNLYVLVASP